jgi:DNA-binding transcriptional regulator YiaG
MKTNLSKTLKAWRARKKLTLEAAARALAVSRRSYEKWEYGQRIPRGMALTALLERIK